MNTTRNSSGLTNETFFANTSWTEPGGFVASWFIPENHRYAFYVLFSMVLLLSFLGNTYIIAIVLRNKQMHSTINYLIVNMAVSDLVGSVGTILPQLSRLHTLSLEWKAKGILGNILCKAYPFLGDVSTAISILSMIVIALERFFAVVYPMKPIPSFLKTRIALPAIWFTATATFAIYLFTYQVITISGMSLCLMMWPSSFDPVKASTILYLTIAIGYFVVPFIIIAFLYLAIACSLKRQKLSALQSTHFERNRRKEDAAIIKMLFAIVACFIGCWFPIQIYVFLQSFVWKGSTASYLLTSCLILVSNVSFSINPILCFIFCRNYRKYLKKAFPFSLFQSLLHQRENELIVRI